MRDGHLSTIVFQLDNYLWGSPAGGVRSSECAGNTAAKCVARGHWRFGCNFHSRQRRDGVRWYVAAVVACLLAACGLIAGEARAQTYPDRPIRVIVPFPAGGLADAVARIVGQRSE